MAKNGWQIGCTKVTLKTDVELHLQSRINGGIINGREMLELFERLLDREQVLLIGRL